MKKDTRQLSATTVRAEEIPTAIDHQPFAGSEGSRRRFDHLQDIQ